MPDLLPFDRPAPLFDLAATRRIEATAQAALPPHTLMQRAGLATARLALALAPHARTVWVACGPGNNGGDGLEA
ncbi:MAG TPA: NAD(P)H-hydrate epimerase, partial [Ottowia sp.]|nr:NAD(P)H-hydrate epimerase [Ottowia sp.]